jgi:hypothetical protein
MLTEPEQVTPFTDQKTPPDNVQNDIKRERDLYRISIRENTRGDPQKLLS